MEIALTSGARTARIRTTGVGQLLPAPLTHTPADALPATSQRPRNARDVLADFFDGLSSGDSVTVEVDDQLEVLPDPAGVELLVDDLAPRIRIGESRDIGVRLTAQPTGTVRVEATVAPGTTGVTVTPGPFSFTTVNWHVQQPITITVDSTAMATETVDVVVSAQGAGVTDSETVVVTVFPETPDLEVENAALDLSIGGTATARVRLTGLPSESVTIRPSVGTDGSTISVSPAALTFGADDFSTYQDVTITSLGPGSAGDTVTVDMVPDETAGLTAADAVTVTLTLVSLPTLEVEDTTLEVRDGETVDVRIRLTAAPPSPVTVRAVSLSGTLLEVASTALTFNAANFATYQSISVTGGEVVDDTNASLEVRATGGITDTETVTVTVIALPELEVEVDTFTIREDQSATIRFRFSKAITNPVTVAATEASDAIASVTPASIVVQPADWNTYQEMVVAAAAIDRSAVTATVTLTPTGEVTNTVSVRITVLNLPELDIEDTTISVRRGETAIIRVRLTSQPTDDVMVMHMETPDSPLISLSPTDLTFTQDNWNVYQDVTVTATPEDD